MSYHRESIANLTKNAMNITKHLLSKTEFKKKNVVLSPLSLQTVLSIVAAGSEGPTQRQLLSFLGSKSIDHLNSLSSHLFSSVLDDAAPYGGPQLSFVNSVWFEKSFSVYPSFKEIVATNYFATLRSLDFINKADDAVKKVNVWAKKETNGRISDVLSPGSIDSLTTLIFANALYFKGAWHQPFDASKTKDRDFHLLGGSSIKVPFMTSKKKQFINAFDGFKILRLPYKKGNDIREFSMYLFLPDARDGLLALIEKVASKPFSAGGLTKMADSPIWVSNIFQKSFIEVNEKGTEAAAVTTTGLLQMARPTSIPTPIDFVADHPFMFLIRDDLSGAILFVGQVLNPLAGRS